MGNFENPQHTRLILFTGPPDIASYVAALKEAAGQCAVMTSVDT